MKLGIIIYSTEAEVVFNAFRLANFSMQEGDEVKVFLLASGVEYQQLDSDKFPIVNLAQNLVDGGAQLLACGTCLVLRNRDGSELCPLSSMKDLYELIKNSDKTVTF
jgi:sulfur relay (sulfurtransferase) complex TusBCD TusD component (DsrE family)